MTPLEAAQGYLARLGAFGRTPESYTRDALIYGFLQYLGLRPQPRLRRSSQGRVFVGYPNERIALPLGFRAANVDTLRYERRRLTGVGGGRYVVYRV